MKAEDTMMGKVQRDNIFYRGIGTLEGVCKMQAEISFKAGYQQALQEHEWDDNYYLGKKAGIKEVVDWIQKHLPYMAIHCAKDWQSQLKEWK